jgi:hypothetical protein
MSTAYPLLLFLLDVGVDEKEWEKIAITLESYFVRRAVCGLSSKNYTRILLSIIGGLNRETATAENVRRQLAERKGDSSEWPSDRLFVEPGNRGMPIQL